MDSVHLNVNLVCLYAVSIDRRSWLSFLSYRRWLVVCEEEKLLRGRSRVCVCLEARLPSWHVLLFFVRSRISFRRDNRLHRRDKRTKDLIGFCISTLPGR